MEDSKEQDLVKRAAQVLNPKIKKYKLQEIQNILSSEFPVDQPVTDTKMSSLCLASSLSDNTPQKNEMNS